MILVRGSWAPASGGRTQKILRSWDQADLTRGECSDGLPPVRNEREITRSSHPGVAVELLELKVSRRSETT